MSTHSFNQFIFQNKSTSINDGEIYTNSYGDAITIGIYGTSSSFEVVFEGKVNEESNWVPLQFANLTTLDLKNSCTDIDTIWNASIAGIQFFRCRIQSINNGDISVVGNIISFY